MRSQRGRGAAVVGGLALVLSACTSQHTSPPSAASARPSPAAMAVGVDTETFVDTSRPTPRWGPLPAQPTRALKTTIFYPATGTPAVAPVRGAPPGRSQGPFPLIVFAHGLGGTPSDYTSLLSSWAAAGFVVAAPLFPLSSSQTPGGPDAGDVANQPLDMTAVIDGVLRTAAQPSGVLSGMVDPNRIGAAGHSNGAITTLGLVANTCCRDRRVKAAVVMAGTTEGFPAGHYELSTAPPMLLVHGTSDDLVPYRSAVIVYNQAQGPKGLVTIRGGSHGAAAAGVASSSSSVIAATTDFFDAYLKGQASSLARISRDGRAGVTTVQFDSRVGSRSTLPVPPAPVVHLHASVSPSSRLVNGQAVTVRWSGYTPGKVVNVLQCSHVDVATANSSGCGFANAVILHPDPTGRGSVSFRVVTGTVGNGVCDAEHNSCSILVNNASSTDPSETRILPISFGG
jgi:dienelactone hydrolase